MQGMLGFVVYKGLLFSHSLVNYNSQYAMHLDPVTKEDPERWQNEGQKEKALSAASDSEEGGQK